MNFHPFLISVSDFPLSTSVFTINLMLCLYFVWVWSWAKKTQKLAVKRNYMRRVLRELMRKKQEQLLNFDIVIRIQKSFYRNDFVEIETEVDQMIARLKK